MYLSNEYFTDGVINANYAVRGRVVKKAAAIEEQIKNGTKKYDFETVLYTNIGNPQALGNRSVTFCRQLIASVLDTSLLGPNSPYPEDVKRKGKIIIDNSLGNSIGAYTGSTGLMVVRKKIAEMITKRDGYKSEPEQIFLTTGATQGITAMLELLVSNKNVGIMVPRPVYPLYTALLTLIGGKAIFYNLDAKKNWQIDYELLEESYKDSNCNVRAICVLNPGNPTPNLFSKECIVAFIKFAKKYNLVILADEVYQLNVYKGENFVSFRKILYDLGPEYSSVQLVSLNSASKGLYCECGLRGGYLELTNVDTDTRNTIEKVFSIRLCPPTPGQVAIYSMFDPPVPGDPSYPLYAKETNHIYNTFITVSSHFHEYFKNYPHVSIQPPDGSIYLYPGISLPEKFVNEAKTKSIEPDEYFCLTLLEKKGICTTPGTGFSQKTGIISD